MWPGLNLLVGWAHAGADGGAAGLDAAVEAPGLPHGAEARVEETHKTCRYVPRPDLRGRPRDGGGPQSRGGGGMVLPVSHVTDVWPGSCAAEGLESLRVVVHARQPRGWRL